MTEQFAQKDFWETSDHNFLFGNTILLHNFWNFVYANHCMVCLDDTFVNIF